MHIEPGVFSCTDGVPEIGIERIADIEYQIDEGRSIPFVDPAILNGLWDA